MSPTEGGKDFEVQLLDGQMSTLASPFFIAFFPKTELLYIELKSSPSQ